MQCPVFFGICGADSVAPAGPTIGYAKEAPYGTIKVYEGLGHFDIYRARACCRTFAHDASRRAFRDGYR